MFKNLIIAFPLILSFAAGGENGPAGIKDVDQPPPAELPLKSVFDDHGRLKVSRGDTVLVSSCGLLVESTSQKIEQSQMTAEEMMVAGSDSAWNLSGGQATGTLRGELRLARNDPAPALAFELGFRSAETLKSWGFNLLLPAKSHLDAEIEAGGRRVKITRRARPRGREQILEVQARTIRFSRQGRVYLEISRDIAAPIIIKDWRAHGGDLNIFIRGNASDMRGGPGGHTCLGFSGGEHPLPPLIYHSALRPPEQPGQPIRAEIGLLANYSSPFNPAEIAVDLEVTAPNGQKYLQPAFFGREFSYKLEKRPPRSDRGAVQPGEESLPVEVEAFEPLADPGWRAMIQTGKSGLYRASIMVTTPDGRATQPVSPLLISRQPGRLSGPLAVSTRDRRYLVDPQGQPVFLLGHNLGWLVDPNGPLPLPRWEAALERMRSAGLNYARIWTCTWSLSFMKPQPYSFDLAQAWKIDRVLQLAAERGIHVQLCLDNFHDFRQNRKLSPFFAGTEPICSKTSDFFTLEKARDLQMARLRYFVARFGHYRNLMAWELWNELDYCIEKNKNPEELQAARKDYLVPWVLDTARKIRSLDRRRRMVTCSLADGTVWPEMSGAPEIGLVESHVYMYMPDPEKNRPARSAREALAEASAEFSRYSKPGFVSEFGFGAGGGPVSPINEKDELGIHLHNGLWVSSLSGHCGAAALWWWDSYLAPARKDSGSGTAASRITGEDRYWHYRALSRFLQGVDWLDGWRELTVSAIPANGPHPVIMGLRTDHSALVWIADPHNTWYSRNIEKYQPPRIEKVAFNIDGLRPGRYQITWWDTYSGKEKTVLERSSTRDGSLRILVPGFSRDVAAKVKLVRNPD